MSLVALENGVEQPLAIFVVLTGTAQSLSSRIPYLNLPIQSGLAQAGRDRRILVVFVAPSSKNWVKDRHSEDDRQTIRLAEILAELSRRFPWVPITIGGLSDGGTKSLEFVYRRPELIKSFVVHSGMLQSKATLAIPAPPTRGLFIATPGDRTPADTCTASERNRLAKLGWDVRLILQEVEPDQRLARLLMHWWSPKINHQVFDFVLEQPTDFVYG